MSRRAAIAMLGLALIAAAAAVGPARSSRPRELDGSEDYAAEA